MSAGSFPLSHSQLSITAPSLTLVPFVVPVMIYTRSVSTFLHVRLRRTAGMGVGYVSSFAGDNFLHGWECSRGVFGAGARPGAFLTWFLRKAFPPGGEIKAISSGFLLLWFAILIFLVEDGHPPKELELPGESSRAVKVQMGIPDWFGLGWFFNWP